MFVMNLTDTELVYSTNGNRIRLFPGTVTEIEDSIVSPEKLKGCYGNMIDIIGEDRVAKIKQELEAPIEEEHTEVLDELFNGAENVFQNEFGKQEGASDEADNINAEFPVKWAAKEAEADAYFENIEQDDDSDKHLKLEISKRLIEEADKEGRCYDNISLMKEIEKVFPEEKAKLIEECKRLEEEHQAELDKAEEGKDGETSKESTENNGELTTPNEEVASTNKETVKTTTKSKTKGNSKKN